MPRRLANVLSPFFWVLTFAIPALAPAQEWYDLYEKGIDALRRKQPVIAAGLFERAARKQPTSGENVLTYGTNRLPKYYPYLKLAEALVMAGDIGGARKALERSEASMREPASERQLVMKAIGEASQESLRSSLPEPTPPSTVSAVPVAREAGATPEPARPTTVAPTVIEAGTPTSMATIPTPSPQASALLAPSPRISDPVPTASMIGSARPLSEGSTSPEAAGSTLAVTTSPGNADVYLDGEYIGRSDGSGRLIKRGIVYGRHELRVGGVDGFAERRDSIDVVSESSQRIVILEQATPTQDSGSTSLSRWIGLFLGSLAAVVVGSMYRRIARVRLRSRRAGSPEAGAAPTKIAPTELDVTRALQAPSHPLAPRVRSVESSDEGPTMALPAEGAAGPVVFGDFLLMEPLGKGGMASVFRARRRGGEDVALKRPLPAFLSESEFVERFIREAEIGRTLNHPNIIRIFEKGHVDEVPYFTMEIVEGETLHALVRREGALPALHACHLVKQVAEALDYSHLKGVIHRDLKPSNVMILKSGIVKVMDYGIARSARLDGLTATGAFLGTPEYVAPETAEGGLTNAQSDLYSLGVVFYEILTGIRPFVGDTPFATLRKICSEPPTPPSAIRNCPSELEAIVLRLLRKTPLERHASAEELLNDLNDYLNGLD